MIIFLLGGFQRAGSAVTVRLRPLPEMGLVGAFHFLVVLLVLVLLGKLSQIKS